MCTLEQNRLIEVLAPEGSVYTEREPHFCYLAGRGTWGKDINISMKMIWKRSKQP